MEEGGTKWLCFASFGVFAIAVFLEIALYATAHAILPFSRYSVMALSLFVRIISLFFVFFPKTMNAYLADKDNPAPKPAEKLSINRQCVKCQNIVPKGSLYCEHCGASQPVLSQEVPKPADKGVNAPPLATVFKASEPTPPAAKRYCQYCGSPLSNGGNVCANCGRTARFRSKWYRVYAMVFFVLFVSVVVFGAIHVFFTPKTEPAVIASSQSTVDKSGISLVEFNSISVGDEYEDVIERIGGEGAKLSETQIDGRHSIIVYKFEGETDGQATITFEKYDNIPTSKKVYTLPPPTRNSEKTFDEIFFEVNGFYYEVTLNELFAVKEMSQSGLK